MPGPGCGRVHGRQRRFAPQRVDDHIDPVRAGCFPQRGGNIGAPAQDHGRVGSVLLCALQPVGVAVGGDDVRSALRLGRLHRNRPHRSGRAEHEHRFTRLQPRPPAQRQPGRQTRVAQRRCGQVIHAVGHIHQCRFGHQGSLGPRPVGGHRSIEEHPASLSGTAHPVGSDHGGNNRATDVERTGGPRQIHMVYPGGRDLDYDLTQQRPARCSPTWRCGWPADLLMAAFHPERMGVQLGTA